MRRQNIAMGVAIPSGVLLCFLAGYCILRRHNRMRDQRGHRAPQDEGQRKAPEPETPPGLQELAMSSVPAAAVSTAEPITTNEVKIETPAEPAAVVQPEVPVAVQETGDNVLLADAPPSG